MEKTQQKVYLCSTFQVSTKKEKKKKESIYRSHYLHRKIFSTPRARRNGTSSSHIHGGPHHEFN